MNSKTIKELVESLKKYYRDFDEAKQLWFLAATEGKHNAASTQKAIMALTSEKINFLKKEINGKLNQPSYRIKLTVNGEPATGFLTNIKKEEIPYLYEIYSKLTGEEFNLLEIKEVYPYLY